MRIAYFTAVNWGRSIIVIALLGLLISAVGCQSSIGRYFGNRARDFGECWSAEIGVGPALGVGVRAAGLLDVGVGYNLTARRGWSYGRWVSDPDLSLDEGWWPLSQRGPGWHSMAHPEGGHRCWWLLPALFSTAAVPNMESEWIWAGESAAARNARVHAFDVEVAIAVGFIYVRLGVSLAEMLDFVAGWFGFDPLLDDS